MTEPPPPEVADDQEPLFTPPPQRRRLQPHQVCVSCGAVLARHEYAQPGWPGICGACQHGAAATPIGRRDPDDPDEPTGVSLSE